MKARVISLALLLAGCSCDAPKSHDGILYGLSVYSSGALCGLEVLSREKDDTRVWVPTDAASGHGFVLHIPTAAADSLSCDAELGVKRRL